MDATTTIREALALHGHLTDDLSVLSDDDDLYEAGMTSHGSVNVMLAVEDAFGVEFPDALLKKATFQSVSAIRGAVESLLHDPSA